MKILLFSNDLMPFAGLPTSGGGLRAFQIYSSLTGAGHEVLCSMPGFTYLARKFASKISPEHKRLFWTFPTQERLLHETKPDAVIFTSNWDHYALNKKPDIPLVVDLHGSRLIETSMFGAPASAERKVYVLAQADHLICAGQRQRNYFEGFLVQAGIIPDKPDFISFVPVSLSPELPEHFPSKEFPTIVSGGGWFPWQNQTEAIKTVSEFDKGKFEIYGGPHNKVAATEVESSIIESFNQLKKRAETNSRIEISNYISRDELLEKYQTSDVALELMDYNLERELAFTTRTIEYLWAGLPVIYNNYGEISDYISRYDAGWCLAPGDTEALRSVLASLTPELVSKKSANAQTLVKEHFTWDKSCQPLLDFLGNPVRREPGKINAFELRPRPSYCSPCIATSYEEITDSSLRTGFVFPADGITSLEFYADCPRLKAKIVSENGEVLSVKEWTKPGRRKYRLPVGRRVIGGMKADLVIQFFPPGSGKIEIASAYNYPVLGGCPAVAIYFVPQEEALRYQLQKGLARAVELVKSKEWKRLGVAITRRAPGIMKQIFSRTNE